MTELEQIQLALQNAWSADVDHRLDWMTDQNQEKFARDYPNLNQVIHNILEMTDASAENLPAR